MQIVHRLVNSLQEGPAIEDDVVLSAAFTSTIVHLCWLGILTIHSICFVYYAVIAWCYWNLPGTLLDLSLYFYELGFGTDYERLVAVVHGCVAAIHLAYMLWMIGWSLKKRQMVFAVYNVFNRSSSSRTSSLSRAYDGFLTKSGMVAVDGPYFDIVILCREIVETALQTQQAYRMSRLVPRIQLNRVYVTLLVLNCWSTVAVHSVFHKKESKRRFFAIVCDCVLDLFTSVGITTILMGIYYPDFDFNFGGFPLFKWFDDVWAVNATSEFQILLVTSVSDLIMRLIFALSTLSNMNNLKKLLSLKKVVKKSNSKHRMTTVVPFTSPQHHDLEDHSRKMLSAEHRFTQILFFIWGFVILALHAYAESLPDLQQCKMQCKPWGRTQLSCYLHVVDCHELGVNGFKEEVAAVWSSVDPTPTVRVVIRHCLSLEMPKEIIKFSHLRTLKVYNVTIVRWNSDAALSQTHHSKLQSLYMARVNFTDGELPLGLQSDDFPQRLQDIEFCTTNLNSLPEDFDTKWPQVASIYLEDGNLTEIPASLARLAPYDLSIAMNPVTDIPASLFRDDVGYLRLTGTRISELPENVTDISPSLKLLVDRTNVSSFWSWIDVVVENAYVSTFNTRSIAAYDTPYCRELQRIFDGDQNRFSVPYYKGQSLLLSNASADNWVTLKTAVSCEEMPTGSTWYPIEFDDIYNKIG